jgi:uncharacterized protein (DUF488 family)
MLRRQRAILFMLSEAGGTASRLEVTKWAFLLRAETPSRGGAAFYQFLPYKFGPYSFCLYHEATALTRDGMMEEVGDRKWRLRSSGKAAAMKLDRAIRTDILDTVERFRGKTVKQLLGYVYDRYRWFTVNSQARPRAARPCALPAVYTAGYEGLLVDGFLNGLMRQGIKRVIDVRNNPVSRRYGFHRSTLARLCGHVDIEYKHFPELGIESDHRQDLDGPEAYAALLKRYERSTVAKQRKSVERVASLVAEKPSALVCMEAQAAMCHRSRLAKAVSRVTGLPIRHLELVP